MTKGVQGLVVGLALVLSAVIGAASSLGYDVAGTHLKVMLAGKALPPAFELILDFRHSLPGICLVPWMLWMAFSVRRGGSGFFDAAAFGIGFALWAVLLALVTVVLVLVVAIPYLSFLPMPG
jgi:hypothetical protein